MSVGSRQYLAQDFSHVNRRKTSLMFSEGHLDTGNRGTVWIYMLHYLVSVDPALGYESRTH